MNLKNKKICLACSSGGHLSHLWTIREAWKNNDRFWVTFKKPDAESTLKDEKKYWCHYPTNRNFKNLFLNFILAFKVLKKEKPDIIISSGAAIAIPFFILGKIMRKKTVYIEVYDRINKGTISGKVCYNFSDLFIVQWEEQLKIYPKAVNLGKIF